LNTLHPSHKGPIDLLGNNSYSRKSLFESLSLDSPQSDQSLSSHPLLPIELLNFAVTILKQLSQKQIELSSISLTKDLFGIISLYSYQQKIQKSLKVHKYFKYFLNFQEKLVSNGEHLDLLKIGFSVLAKLTFNNESSQRYFFQKNGHKLMIKMMQKEFQANPLVLRETLFCLLNCCQIKDFKLLLWSYGFVDVILMHSEISLANDLNHSSGTICDFI
jgi:hypothetical protein